MTVSGGTVTEHPGYLRLNNPNKVLIVSNSPTFLERNKRLLTRAGVRILAAVSAKEALKIHYTERVNLIIALLGMPEMGGDALCSLIRQIEDLRKVSFILVCNDTPDQLDRASHCGSNAWLTRPVNPTLLRETVAKLLTVPPRRDYRAFFRAKVRGRRKTFSFTGISRNISTAGLLIESDRMLCENDLIKGMFVVSGSQLIAAECRVVRTVRREDGTYQYGVRFSKIDPECRRTIEKYVANGN
jgi:CheY-like chemotaxis protein